MKIKNFIIKLFIIYFIFNLVKADEIEIDASDIKVQDEGRLITAFNSKINIPKKKLNIESKVAEYNKQKKIITFIDDVYFFDEVNNIIIKSDLIKYDENKNLIYSPEHAEFFIDEKYNLKSNKIYFNRSSNEIYSNEVTVIIDDKNNTYNLEDEFHFDISNEIILSKKSSILDNEKNKYIFEDLAINLKLNEIVGKEIKIEYENSYFGNPSNRPILKGRSGFSNEESLKIYKAVFSTCNVEEKKCRGWELNTETFNHDKINKVFEYKNSWLKLFDYKVFYAPYFSHPDPTVKRKSGFLTPSYVSSNTLGVSLITPYFKVISHDKDMTFSPKFYADKSFMLQNEYRQVLESGKIQSDFSFLFGEHGTKSHFFYSQFGELNSNLSYDLNLQDVKGDNYIKTHSLKQTTPLIDRDDYLLSNFDLNWVFADSSLNTSVKLFENLSGNRSDRYTFVLPDFDFTKKIDLPESYNGSFNFNSYGNLKNYDTNINDITITNDFLFESDEYISVSGFSTNYDILLKNYNYYANQNNKIYDNRVYDLTSVIKVESSLPLEKQTEDFTNILKPIVSLRYSPNGNSDLSNKNTLLNYNSVFSLNRLGSSSEIEGGASLSLGLEFNKKNNSGFEIFDFKIANVLRLKEDYRLPRRSKLNKTRSDIFGNLRYNFDDHINIGYFFSYDRDLKYSNLDQLDASFSVNNFVSKFAYYTEKNDLGDKENIKNNSSFRFNNENSLNFSITKDLKDDYTQFYDLIYNYQTDCISIDLNYNKSFYRDGNVEPNQSLSFLIKIIPFNEFGVPNLGNVIGY